MEEKLVSVIIPNYNRSNLIISTVQSVLNQSYSNLEIIIVDDYSSDDSRDTIMSLMKKDSRIKKIFLESNKGANYCRNIGVSVAEGEYIAFLDSDDEFEENKIEVQVNCMEKMNEQVGIIFTNISVNGKAIGKMENQKVHLNKIMFRNELGGFSTVFLKKTVFNEIGGLDEDLKSCQDWEFYLRVLSKYDGYYISLPLVKYFLQEDSISKNLDKVIKGHKIVLKKIVIINDERKLVKPSVLQAEQLLLLGDIFRRFKDFRKANIYYTRALKENFSMKGIINKTTVMFNGRIYKLFR